MLKKNLRLKTTDDGNHLECGLHTSIVLVTAVLDMLEFNSP